VTIHEFIERDTNNLIALIADVKQTYGRLPAEIVVGPPIEHFESRIEFYGIPLRWDWRAHGGEVLALLSDTTIFDRKAAQARAREIEQIALHRSRFEDWGEKA
jgi:hypothetical protein